MRFGLVVLQISDIMVVISSAGTLLACIMYKVDKVDKVVKIQDLSLYKNPMIQL